MSSRKLFTFEGIDGCGKTTQAKTVQKYLRDKNIDNILIREPGGTILGEEIRSLLLDVKRKYNENETKICSEAEMLLFLTSRAEIVEEILIPSLKNGRAVLLDRFIDSTRAYQGGGRYKSSPEKIDLINRVNYFATQGIVPLKTFYFDMDYETMLSRTKRHDRMESSGKEFFERVIQEYRTIAKEEPDRVVLIDGAKSEAIIFNEDILPVVNNIYGLR